MALWGIVGWFYQIIAIPYSASGGTGSAPNLGLQEQMSFREWQKGFTPQYLKEPSLALWAIVGSPYLSFWAMRRISAYGSRFFTSLRMSSSWCQVLPHNSSKSQKYLSCWYPYKQRYTNLKATNPLIQKIRVLYFHFFSVPSLSIKGGAWSRASMRKIITIKAKGICVKWSKPISYWLT